MSQAQSNPVGSREDIDDAETDINKLLGWAKGSEVFIKKICEKLGIQYFSGYQKGKEMRKQILDKIEELMRPMDEKIVQRINALLNEKLQGLNVGAQGSAQVVDTTQKDEEIRRLKTENTEMAGNIGDLKKAVVDLEKQVADLKKSVELYSQEGGEFLVQHHSMFTSEVAAGLAKNFNAYKNENMGVQRIILDHINKKIIVEYDLIGSLNNPPSIESIDQNEQGLTPESQDKFITFLRKVMGEILKQNNRLLGLITEMKNYIHFENNCEEDHIKQGREEIKKKDESMKAFCEQLGAQRTFREFITVLEDFYENKIKTWDASYEFLVQVYHRLLKKAEEMTYRYETMIQSYLIGEEEIGSN